MAKSQHTWYHEPMSLLDNRKALFSYEVQETLEAGIELFGYEVKAVRKGMGSLAGSYVALRGGEAYLVGSLISPYQPGNTPKEYDPKRLRKLLFSREELEQLENKVEKGGLTLVPISMYNKGRYIKVEVALARGKKKHDKRQSIKKRETNIEIERTLKSGR